MTAVWPRVGLLLAALAACDACSGPSSTRSTVTDAGAPEAAVTRSGLAPSSLPPDFHCDPTLESIRTTIFLTSCAFDSCHGDNNFVWALRLSADLPGVSAELVNAPAYSCKPRTRVVPGDPAHSFLYEKLAEPKPSCGYQMPYGTEPLPESALACVRGWIESLPKTQLDAGHD